jgi:hypothetical protein
MGGADDFDAIDVSFMTRDDAGQLMEDSGAGNRPHLNANSSIGNRIRHPSASPYSTS